MKGKIAKILRAAGKYPLAGLIHHLSEEKPEKYEEERVVAKARKPRQISALKLALGFHPIVRCDLPLAADEHQPKRRGRGN